MQIIPEASFPFRDFVTNIPGMKKTGIVRIVNNSGRIIPTEFRSTMRDALHTTLTVCQRSSRKALYSDEKSGILF
jgi:hypothetical protein